MVALGADGPPTQLSGYDGATLAECNTMADIPILYMFFNDCFLHLFASKPAGLELKNLTMRIACVRIQGVRLPSSTEQAKSFGR